MEGHSRPESAHIQAEKFLREEDTNTGIITFLDSEGYELKFWHLSFQEFLAGQAIAAHSENEQRRILFLNNRFLDSEWREAVLQLAGILWKHGKHHKVNRLVEMILDNLYPALKPPPSRAPALTITDRIRKYLRQPGTATVQAVPSLAYEARTYGLLGALVRDLKPYGYKVDLDAYRKLETGVLGIFDREAAESIPLQIRIEAAEALGQAGDPRLNSKSPFYNYGVRIPAGNFWMGAQNNGSGANR